MIQTLLRLFILLSYIPPHSPPLGTYSPPTGSPSRSPPEDSAAVEMVQLATGKPGCPVFGWAWYESTRVPLREDNQELNGEKMKQHNRKYGSERKNKRRGERWDGREKM